MVTVTTDLTVEDINNINSWLNRFADGFDWSDRKRIADLMWKLTFLGRAIEIAGKQADLKDSEAGALGSDSTVSDVENKNEPHAKAEGR
jgi:hypothetical protein